jgi:hypothetical protein
MSLDSLQAECPFSFRISRNGLVLIAYHGRTVTTLANRQAAQFIRKIEHADAGQAQLLMAKATGHFKHGTERTQDKYKG